MPEDTEKDRGEDTPWASKRVVICGSRTWDDDQIIDVIVSGLAQEYAPLTVIHGAAPGADSMAEESAHVDQVRGRAVDVVRFPADWDRHGRAAGPLRNQQMLDDGKPDWVFAFTDDLEASRGTRDMVRRAYGAGVPIYVVGRYGPGYSDRSSVAAERLRLALGARNTEVERIFLEREAAWKQLVRYLCDNGGFAPDYGAAGLWVDLFDEATMNEAAGLVDGTHRDGSKS